MFEEFITNGTLEQKERARNWQTAIGLQDVDGLKVSPYLVELAKKHIEGTISIDEVEKQNTMKEFVSAIIKTASFSQQQRICVLVSLEEILRIKMINH